MTVVYLRKIISPLSFLILSATFCYGQINTNLPEDSSLDSKEKMHVPAKLVKTQGSNQYQNIHCSLLDKNGNLWFGTTGEGAYCYDGKRFIQFTVNDGLTSNTIWSILQDRSGYIWFGTDMGLCRYDGKKIIGVPIITGINMGAQPSYLAGNPTAKNEVWSIMQDRNDKLWIGTTTALYCFNGKSFTRFLDNQNLINSAGLRLTSVQCIAEDKAGNIWFGSGPLAFEGLVRFDGHSLIGFKPGGETWIRHMVEDKAGNMWLATRHNGVWRYTGKEFTKLVDGKDLGLHDADIALSMLIDKKGNIWLSGAEDENGFGADGGVWRYDGNVFKNFTTKAGLGNYSVWSMVEDTNNNIWFGTRNNSLYRYDGNTFTKFSE